MTSRIRVVELALVFLLILAPLIYFIDKPFHIDDPLFIKVARQVLVDPLRPFDFSVNWDGNMKPMWEETKNPPLVSYFIAPIIKFYGEREKVLHAFFVPFALFTAAMVYLLARRFRAPPLLASVFFLATPAFLVSADTIMSDVPALGVFLWALYLVIRGYDRDSDRLIAMGHLLAGVTILMKYSGVILLPLFLVIYLLRSDRRLRRLGYLAIPLGIGYLWHAHTAHAYGYSHLADSSFFSIFFKRDSSFWLPQSLSFLAFFSGCSIFTIPLVPLYLRIFKRKRIIFSAAVALGAAISLMAWTLLKMPLEVSLLLGALGIPSIIIIAHVVRRLTLLTGEVSLERRADPSGAGEGAVTEKRDEFFLYLWLVAGSAFVYLIAWCIAARFMLLAYPPLAILAARLFARAYQGRLFVRYTAATCAVTYLFALFVLNGDVVEAQSFKALAERVAKEMRFKKEATYHLSNWGFKYYLERHGFDREIDVMKTRVQVGEYIIAQWFSDTYDLLEHVKENKRFYAREVFNGYAFGPVNRAVEIQTVMCLERASLVTVTNSFAHAGFHASLRGILPFNFAKRAILFSAVWKVIR